MGSGPDWIASPSCSSRLRGVDHEELIAADAEQAVAAATSRGKSKRLAADDIGDVFGIEIDAGTADANAPPEIAPSNEGQVTAACEKSASQKSQWQGERGKDREGERQGQEGGCGQTRQEGGRQIKRSVRSIRLSKQAS